MLVYDSETGKEIIYCDECERECTQYQILGNRHFCIECLSMFDYYNQEGDNEDDKE